MSNNLIDVNEVARRLSVSPRAVWKWVAAGRLPAPVRLGRSVRWRETDISRFIADGCDMTRFEAGKEGGKAWPRKKEPARLGGLARARTTCDRPSVSPTPNRFNGRALPVGVRSAVPSLDRPKSAARSVVACCCVAAVPMAWTRSPTARTTHCVFFGGVAVTVEDIVRELGGVRSGKGYMCFCPAHDDANRSLSVTLSEGRLLVHCFGGCSQEAVIAALRERGLWPGAERRAAGPAVNAKGNAKGGTVPQGRIVIAYDYCDEHGQLLYQVCRLDPKDFRQRRPDTEGGWTWNLQGVRRVLYCLPEILGADKTATVFIPEGEKDCDRIMALGLVATCNPGGVGKWRTEYAETLRGRRVVILPDNDDPGRKHAEQVARSLHGVAESVRVVSLQSLPDRGDISDWLDAGGTVEQLHELVETTPESARSGHANGAVGSAAAVVTCMAKVKPEPVRWLWPGRIPLAKLTLFAGNPGLGKSFTTLDIAARLSVGGTWPDGAAACEPADVCILSAEDDLADTVRPRLDRHQADVRRIHVVTGILSPPEDNGAEPRTRWVELDRDLRHIEAVIVRHNVRLLIIDPVSGYMGNANSHVNAEVRSVLGPIAGLVWQR